MNESFGAAHYPDPAIQPAQAEFNNLILFNASVERLATGCRWSEGPVWFGDGRFLLWSDIPNNRILRWDETDGHVSVFRHPSHHANGNTRDRQGRLITCEHETRRVTRTETDGSITVLVDQYEGRPLNSPNDVVVTSDGSIWFSDPVFGIMGWYEGQRHTPQLPTGLYRLDPQTQICTCMVADIANPNGLAFSPDEKTLYVVSSSAKPHRVIYAFDVLEGGLQLANKRVLIDAGPEGTPDGLRVDIYGNLWCGWGMGRAELDGVMVFNPQGERLGQIRLPERCANLCFGGRHRNRLFMATGHGLYALYVNTQGVAGG